jgi:hypothetical protein
MQVAAEVAVAAEGEAEVAVAVAAEGEAEAEVAAEGEVGGVPTASGSGPCGFATERPQSNDPGRGDAAPSTGAQVAHPDSE